MGRTEYTFTLTGTIWVDDSLKPFESSRGDVVGFELPGKEYVALRPFLGFEKCTAHAGDDADLSSDEELAAVGIEIIGYGEDDHFEKGDPVDEEEECPATPSEQ